MISKISVEYARPSWSSSSMICRKTWTEPIIRRGQIYLIIMDFATAFDNVLHKRLGPVVQSVVSLTSSLRVISLTVLADSIYNIMIFFLLKKCE